MHRTKGSDFHFSLDNVLIGKDLAWGFGWAFHDSLEITSIRLEVETGLASRQASIEASLWKARPDVALSFPGRKNSLHSGFYFYGGWELSGCSLEKVLLRILFSNGQSFVHTIAVDETGKLPAIPMRSNIFLLYAKRSLAYLKSGNFSGFFRRASRFLDNTPWRRSSLASFNNKVRSIGAPVTLLLDHDLGGGANVYREEVIKQKLAAGAAILVLTYDVRRFEYCLELRSQKQNARLGISSLDLLRDLMERWLLSEIFYNNCVSFRDPASIPVLLAGLRRDSNAVLRVAIHDFLPVCPSQHLINADGKFCGIPEIHECRICLNTHKDGFVSLFVSRNIDEWRRQWLDLLDVADEILCFSGASKELLLRAHPSLSPDKIKVVPHRVSAAASRQPAIHPRDPLHIGIVGNISVHKGALVVRDLAQEIMRRGLGTKITVIGSIDIASLPDCLTETGSYEPHELPKLIEASGANVFLLPSICPETFSYVTEHLIQLSAPLACFNLGAPAERVKRYNQGTVLDYIDSRRLLDDLFEFHDVLVSRVAG